MYYLYIAVFLWLIFQSHFVSAVALSSQQDAEIDASSLNVRSGPGMRYDVLQALPRGTPVTILESAVLGRDEGTTETWSKIIVELDGRRVLGWVCDLYLTDHAPEVAEIEPQIVPDAEPDVAEESPPVTADVTPEARPAVGPALVQDVTAPTPPNVSADAPEIAAAEEGDARPRVATAEFGEVEDAPATADFSVQADIDPLRDLRSLELNGEDALRPVQPFGDAIPATPDTAITPDLRSARTDPSIDVEAPEPAPAVPPLPLTYAAERIDCESGYFFDGLTGCTADVSYRVRLPAEFASFAAGEVGIVCDVAFTYRSGPNAVATTEIVTRRTIAELVRGEGDGELTAEIDFRYRVPDVTEVSVEETLCRLTR